MANIDEKFGFRLSRKRGKCVEAGQYTKASAAVIYEGDLVGLNASNQVIVHVAAAGKCLGVAAHSNTAVGATAIAVYDDPESVFEAQITTFALVDGGQNSDVAAAPTPNTLSNRSGQQVDAAANAVTAALPLKIMGLSDREGNEVGANAKVYVKLNNCVKGSGDGSTGI